MRRILPAIVLAAACLLATAAQAQLDPRLGGGNGGIAPTTTPTITNREAPNGGTQVQVITPPAQTASQAPAPPAEKRSPRGPGWCASRATDQDGLSGFQQFILSSTGRVLCPFGHDLFLDVPSTFAPLENVPVSADYVVGPGDELHIRGWGQIDIDYRTVVDRNGTINIPRVGVVQVAGVRAKDLTEVVRNAVSQTFRNFELSVSLGQLRSVQIFVVGQARRPGTYTVSSMSTLVNAIFAAGGPSERGSMRSIQLKRGNRVVADLDLYDLLISGDKSGDAALLPGDVLYIPPIGPLVALNGSVNVPAATLVDPTTKGFTSLADAQARFNAQGVSKDKRVIAYCGGGISATVDLFVLHQLGYDNLTLYDASMGEWARDASLPIETD